MINGVDGSSKQCCSQLNRFAWDDNYDYYSTDYRLVVYLINMCIATEFALMRFLSTVKHIKIGVFFVNMQYDGEV